MHVKKLVLKSVLKTSKQSVIKYEQFIFFIHSSVHMLWACMCTENSLLETYSFFEFLFKF